MGRHSLPEPRHRLIVRDRREQQAREGRQSWALIGVTTVTVGALAVGSVFASAVDPNPRAPLALYPAPDAAPVVNGVPRQTRASVRFAFEPRTDIADVVHAVPIPLATPTPTPPRVERVVVQRPERSEPGHRAPETTRASTTPARGGKDTARPSPVDRQRVRELVKHIVQRASGGSSHGRDGDGEHGDGGHSGGSDHSSSDGEHSSSDNSGGSHGHGLR